MQGAKLRNPLPIFATGVAVDLENLYNEVKFEASISPDSPRAQEQSKRLRANKT
jgi:hypothetical protein